MTRFKLKHNTKDYIRGNIKLWLARYLYRIIRQRKSLTLLIVITVLALLTFGNYWAFGFLFLIFMVSLIDLILFVIKTIRQVNEIRGYIQSQGEDIEIVCNHYFAFWQDGQEFGKVEWKDVYEICRLNNPKLFSFRSRQTKNSIIIYASEIKEGYSELLEMVLDSSDVNPLV